ncbi:MAG: hypothetical protein SO072_07745 [Dysosmobacter sp.]|nr:hypothetical protein [Dysosmobacter sp.]
MDEYFNKHYINIDTSGRVIDAWSDGPIPVKDTDGAICINAQGSYQFRLNGEENPPLHTMDGIPLYKWDGSKVILRTDAELEADRAALPNPGHAATVEARLTALEAEAEQAKADREALNILLGGAE